MKNLLLLCLLITGAVRAQHTHFVAVENGVFVPELLVVEAGDRIALNLTDGQTFTEVSAATFRAGGTVPNGGIRIGDGLGHDFNGTDADQALVTLNDPGDLYFVSEGPNRAAAKMHIVVIPATNTGVSPSPDRMRPRIFPNPANDQVRFAAHQHLPMMSVEAFDESGRRVLESVVRGGEPLNVLVLPAGYYTLRLTDGMSTVYGIERLVIERSR